MIRPIRFSDVVGHSAPPVGLIVEVEAPDGTRWELTSGDGDRHRNIFLLPDRLKGFRGSVEWETTETVSGFGERRLTPHGWRTPAFDANLTVGLRAERGELEDLIRRWESAWSWDEYGKIHFRSGGREQYWAPIFATGFSDWPDNLQSRRYVESAVSCRVPLGHFFGRTVVFVGNSTVRVRGDRPLPASAKLLWSQAGSVTFPSGRTVAFPSPGGAPRWINLDRGMMGQVTRMDGTVDSAAWSALQGNVTAVDIMPNTDSTWLMDAGFELHVTPRFLSPWR